MLIAVLRVSGIVWNANAMLVHWEKIKLLSVRPRARERERERERERWG